MKTFKSEALRCIGVAGALAGVLAVSTAMAGPSPQSTTFKVLAQVPARCIIDGASDLNFGIIDPEAVNQDTSTIDYRCTAGTQPDVALDYTGSMSSASSATSLDYTLYQEGTYSTTWGTGTDSNNVVPAGTGLAAGQQKTATVYGEITTADAATAGVATDFEETVTVTFTF